MHEPDPFPRSYQEWRECITVRCGLDLHRQYIVSRLQQLRDASHPKTREFVGKYGEIHLRQIVRWFEIAHEEGS